MKKNDDLVGKVVLVTGGSRGLGRALCRGFADQGAKVVIASRKLDACEKLADELKAAGADVLALACHVGDWDSLEAVVDTVVHHFGRLDVLINNAGMSPLAPSQLKTSEALFDKIIGVNLKGPFRLSALAADRMAKTGGGSIINISSVASQRPAPYTGVYSAAKAGLNALTKAHAQAFAESNVRVNAIVCGVFDTDAITGFAGDPAMRREIEKQAALNRIGQPEEIVGAALYFASAASSYTTGSLLNIDGCVIN